MGKALKYTLGGFLGGKLLKSAPKADKPQAVSEESEQETEEDKKRRTAQRSKLYETEGGSAGSALDEGQVGTSRSSIFGN